LSSDAPVQGKSRRFVRQDQRAAGSWTRAFRKSQDRLTTLDGMTTASTVQAPQTSGLRQMLNKVPEVTIYFWLIKCLCTTVGETFSDDLVSYWSGGSDSVPAQNSALLRLTFVTAGVLAVVLLIQFTRKRYVAPVYWVCVVVISVFGTQLTDNFEGNGEVPKNMVAITIVSAALTAIVFAVWWYVERTLSMHSIRTHRREAFYWAAVCATFAMGTAVGDLVAEKFSLGYLTTLLLFVVVIAVVAAVWRYTSANGVLMFWLAYIMTRPLGASTGDWLSQKGNQGLALGVHVTSDVFLGLIVLFVAFLQIRKPDLTPVELVYADEVHHPHLHHPHAAGHGRPPEAS
jgi:uncharacterized membrane-anchored protein